jgi:membrane protein
MAAASHPPTHMRQGERQQHEGAGVMGDLRTTGQRLAAFWKKLSNDWVFNLSGLLAYNFLMSGFSILFVLLAIGGFLLGMVSPNGQAQLQSSIANALPNGTASQLMVNVTRNLNKSAGLLFAVGIVVAIFTGSRLFITIENAFGIVFRLRGRDVIHQNLMAIGMLLLYAVLIPIVLLASILPASIVRVLPIGQNSPVLGFVIQVAGNAIALLAAFLLFGAIYVVVPNRPVRLREVWRGTLVASLLLVLYEVLFPFYVNVFLKPQNYGSTAGFAVVILIFFYYLAFILLVGAEINSWAAGQRQTGGDIVAILHELQAHNTTRGVAGPTAGMPQEDLQHHRGADAMRTPEAAIEHERTDHDNDAQPPEFAESGVSAPGYHVESPGEQRQVSAETEHERDRPHEEPAITERHDKAELATRQPHGGSSRDDRPDDGQRDAGQPRGGRLSVANPPPEPRSRSTERDARPPRPDTSLAFAAPAGPLDVPDASGALRRRRRAFWAVLATGAVAVVPVVRLLPDLLREDERHAEPAR